MKLYSKEVLILGGIYNVLDTPFAYANIDYITDFLFIAFVLFMFMLLFNRVPKFISYLQNKYPTISYYLAAIGWIPYFLFLTFFMIILISLYQEDLAQNIMQAIFPIKGIDLILAGISLIVAFVRRRLKMK